ncbi:hypothetical protein NIES4071_52490 [Calothrix sp. NIES-4071]|nr:hypothetical protein NIES4071_52490 [Calothrix sp. NIES-4071]BAZ59557.1 hypothetical protein NIES4105_52440 [Calothrix sp. NIES-4105]
MKKTINIVFFWLTLVLSGGYSVAGQNISIKEPLKFNPPNNGAPGGNRSRTSTNTGSRGCPSTKKSLTALMPKNNWENTLTEHPTFWFYIPYERGRLTLILKDQETAATVARASYEISKGAGIMGFPIPKTALALKVKHAYRWRIYFSCDPNSQTPPTEVQGVVQRVAVDKVLKTKLASATTIEERIILYANQGFWYETITALIESRRSSPQDKELQKQWSDLLSDSDVGLENLIPEPLVQCCNHIAQ